MSQILFFVVLFILIILVGWLLNRFYYLPKLRKEAEAAPRITMAEVDEFWSAIEKASLPMAKAIVLQRDLQKPSESKIGGAPLAIDNGAAWPKGSRNNVPMTFICQINFADFPDIKDFPEKGLMQIFTSFDVTNGDYATYEHAIRWEPDPKTEEFLEIPLEIQQGKDENSYFSERVRLRGLPIEFQPAMAPGNPYNWPFAENDLMFQNRLPENEAVESAMKSWEGREVAIQDGYGTHWVGGHPVFVQEDIRYNPAFQELDRVIFHLGFDDDICLGDAGELNVMISRDALLAKDFKKAVLTWDCA